MTDSVVVKIEGADELQNLMRTVQPRVRKKHLRRSTTQSAALVRDAVRKAAPVDTGKLRKNIRSKSRKGKRFYTKASVFINVADRTQGREISGKFMSTGNKGADKKDAYYWRFLEFGTKHQTAQPFIRPTAENMLRKVTAHIVSATRRGITEEVNKVKVRK